MIYPNCSEIIWRLKVNKESKSIKDLKLEILRSLANEDNETNETDTATFPNSCLDNMIICLEELKGGGLNPKDVGIEIIDNCGGGGNEIYVKACFEIAKKVILGKISKEKAEELCDELSFQVSPIAETFSFTLDEGWWGE